MMSKELVNGVSCDLPSLVTPSDLQSDSKRENCLIVDWFSVSIKFDFEQFASDLIHKNNFHGYDSDLKDPSNDFVDYVSREFAMDFIENILLLEDPFITWLTVPGYYGFRHRLYFNGISVHFGGNSPRGLNNMILVEMSGSGCRSYDEWGCNSWPVLFSLALNRPDIYHCTRLDVAYDDFTGVLDIKKLDRENEKHNLTTTFRDYRIEKSYVKEDMCIYYGSMASEIMFRCYNKAAERNRSEEIDHWIRFEMQLRDSRALAFIQSYLSTGCFGGTFSGIIDKCLRYVTPTGNDTNKSRWNSPKWWTDFIGTTSEIQDFTKRILNTIL